MRIVLWHGYLLGGTGSNVYTRQLAREWSLAGHDVVVLSQEPQPERYDLGARDHRETGRRRLPARVRASTATRATRCDGCPTAPASSSTAGSTRTSPRSREQQPAELVFANHVLLGGPVGAASGMTLRRQGARLGARVRDARQRVALGLGRRGARAARRRRSSARATSARCWRTSAVTSTACTRCRPGVDIEEWVPEERDTALAGLLDEARHDPPNPGNANERLPDERNADAAGGGSSSGRRPPSSTSAS